MIKIDIEKKDLIYIINTLAEKPYIEVYKIINDLQVQLEEKDDLT